MIEDELVEGSGGEVKTGEKKKIMTTPRLIRSRFNDTQKPMDVISDRRDS